MKTLLIPFLMTSCINQARDLTIAEYTSKPDKLGVQENAFDLHLRRATLATTIDKSAHITKPEIPTFTEYGWSFTDGNAVSLASTAIAIVIGQGNIMQLYQRLPEKLFLCDEGNFKLLMMPLPGIGDTMQQDDYMTTVRVNSIVP